MSGEHTGEPFEIWNGQAWRRVPITSRQRGDAPDIRHGWLSIEAKHRKVIPAWIREAIDQAIAARRGDQLPVGILHEAGTRHTKDLVLIRLDDFIDWFGEIDAEAVIQRLTDEVNSYEARPEETGTDAFVR